MKYEQTNYYLNGLQLILHLEFKQVQRV